MQDDLTNQFNKNGFLILQSIFNAEETEQIVSFINTEQFNKAGSRNFLSQTWCQSIANELKRKPLISSLLPDEAVAVQCTFFKKNTETNWLVAYHRDMSIPVRNKINSNEWTGWSEKENVIYAKPPKQVLESLVAIRLHLETNDDSNGPLKVIPGSHLDVANTEQAVTCHVPKGGVLIMKPLLLHASSKLQQGDRQVLHFLYGPQSLPDQAEWPIMIS